MYMKKKMYMRQTQYSVVVIHVLKQSQFNCFAMSGGGGGGGTPANFGKGCAAKVRET